jgi:hypothetical protein
LGSGQLDQLTFDAAAVSTRTGSSPRFRWNCGRRAGSSLCGMVEGGRVAVETILDRPERAIGIAQVRRS